MGSDAKQDQNPRQTNWKIHLHHYQVCTATQIVPKTQTVMLWHFRLLSSFIFHFRCIAMGTGSYSIGVTSVPIPSISMATVSPGFRYTGGLRPLPTPDGVPVAITSPGQSVIRDVTNRNKRSTL